MSFRTVAGSSIFVVAPVLWFLGLVNHPYDAQATLPPVIRPSVAEIIFDVAAVSVGLLLLSAFVLRHEMLRERSWRRWAFLSLWLFVFSTGLARALWIKLYILGPLS